MKKLNNKGMIATEILAILFVPGVIPLMFLAFLYKVIKPPRLALAKIRNR